MGSRPAKFEGYSWSKDPWEIGLPVQTWQISTNSWKSREPEWLRAVLLLFVASTNQQTELSCKFLQGTTVQLESWWLVSNRKFNVFQARTPLLGAGDKHVCNGLTSSLCWLLFLIFFYLHACMCWGLLGSAFFLHHFFIALQSIIFVHHISFLIHPSFPFFSLFFPFFLFW